MEILDLRHFSSADLRPLMEDETQVWSRLLSWDYSGSAEMILRYVDAKILTGYAAIERGRIFGYSFFVYEVCMGVIGDLYVTNGNRLPDARKVELQLLTHVIEPLHQSPGIHRIVALPQQHRALSGTWRVRCGVILRGARSEGEEPHRSHPVFARPKRCRPRNPGLRLAGILLSRHWRVAAGRHGLQFAKTQFLD